MAGAADTAKLIASLTLKDGLTPVVKTVSASLDKLDKNLGKTQDRGTKAAHQIGAGFSNSAKLIAGASVAIAGAGTVLFLDSIQKASDLNETVSKTRVVFGQQADAILAFGKTSAEGLGLSENAALAAASTYGNLFVSMGLASTKSAEMSQRLVTLASDLASFNNIDPSEAADKLRSGLVGESEPLRTLGININETVLKARALEMGLLDDAKATQTSTKSKAELALEHVQLTKAEKAAAEARKKYGAGSEQALKAQVAAEKAQKKLDGTVQKSVKTTQLVLTPAQKALAAYAEILAQSGTAQGDFARTSSGLANQQRIFTANWENLQATLAGASLPAIAKILDRINKLVKDNMPAIQHLGDNIAGLFSDQNIETGAKFIGDVFKAAQDAAPVLADAAGKVGQLVETSVGLFRSLPPEIQALAIAGLTINKLTGGLVTNLAGGLISAVISSFKGMMNVTAGVVNVNAAASTGGVPTPGGGTGFDPVGFAAKFGFALTSAGILAGAVNAAGNPAVQAQIQSGGGAVGQRASQFQKGTTDAVQDGFRKLLSATDRAKAAAAANARSIAATIKAQDLTPNVIIRNTVPVTTQTIINGRLVAANFSRYTSVIGGKVVNATSQSGV